MATNTNFDFLRKMRWFVALGVAVINLVLGGWELSAETDPEREDPVEIVRSQHRRKEVALERFKAPEARQGVAVDERFYYIISNTAIGKYDRETKERVARWSCPEEEPLIHLNAGIVLDGKLYCAHSNYGFVPMTSSIEIWDTKTLEHIETYSFGVTTGSLTWFDRKDGFWYLCFAHYSTRAAEPNRDPSWTTLVQYDRDWNRRQSWVFPSGIVSLFDRYSSSGGAFGSDGLLYISGHDNAQLYVLGFPEMGSRLVWLDTIDIEAEGQAFAWDPLEPWRLHSVLKREREVISSIIASE